MKFRIKSLKELLVFAILTMIGAEHAKQHYTGNEPWSKQKDFLIAHIRYWMWYGRLITLIRPYIRSQIQTRFTSMQPECLNQGSCVICGCTTTQLQMAHEACEKPCYPTLMSRKSWKHMQRSMTGYHYDATTKTYWRLYNNKFIQVTKDGDSKRRLNDDKTSVDALR